MNICFVTPYSPREVTGVSKFVNDLSRSLRKRDIDSFIITRLAKPQVEAYGQIKEINCSYIPYLKDIFLGIVTVIHIFKLRKEISLLHLQTPLPQSALSALIGRLLGIPVVTTVHGKFPVPRSVVKKKFYSFTEEVTFTASNKLIFVSKDAKNYFNVSNGLVILNGIDTDSLYLDHNLREKKRAQIGIGEDVVFIYLGRLVSHKGIYDLLECFEEIVSEGNRKTKLLFVGTGDSSKLLTKINELKISDHVLLIGKVDNIHEYLCAADSFVLFTSSLEGLPLALLEAMACGVVPIATNVSGIPEVIIDGNVGFLVKYGDRSDLKEKMIWCITNKEKLHIIGGNAIKRINENNSLDKMADEYLEVYKSLTNE